ncbi:hypothetical protein ACU686_07690 [Yinghuangia aomiensis]
MTYATLHNPADIARRGLMLGDHVIIVYRAGELIPRVEGGLPPAHRAKRSRFDHPEACPALRLRYRSAARRRWRCERGRACGRTEAIRMPSPGDALGHGRARREDHRAARRQVGLDIEDFADLFTLTRDQLLTLDRMGDKSADDLMAAIDAFAKRQAPQPSVSCALGVLGTGHVPRPQRIAAHLGSDAWPSSDAGRRSAWSWPPPPRSRRRPR